MQRSRPDFSLDHSFTFFPPWKGRQYSPRCSAEAQRKRHLNTYPATTAGSMPISPNSKLRNYTLSVSHTTARRMVEYITLLMRISTDPNISGLN